jgi:hypothetical protein
MKVPDAYFIDRLAAAPYVRRVLGGAVKKYQSRTEALAAFNAALASGSVIVVP